MELKNCKKGDKLKVVCINCDDKKLKLRLCEIGFFNGSVISVLEVSALKNTLLIHVLDSCFCIKSKMAESIEVEYV